MNGLNNSLTNQRGRFLCTLREFRDGMYIENRVLYVIGILLEVIPIDKNGIASTGNDVVDHLKDLMIRTFWRV